MTEKQGYKRPNTDEIRQRIAALEELQTKHPEIDALSNDGGLLREQYIIWQNLKTLPLWRQLLANGQNQADDTKI